MPNSIRRGYLKGDMVMVVNDLRVYGQPNREENAKTAPKM